MPKSPAAFPRLMRALATAGERRYDVAHVSLSPGDTMMAAAGRRTFHTRLNLSPQDHATRMALVLTDALRDPLVRADLRALLDSYEEPSHG